MEGIREKFGFIGAGNMARAILGGMIKAGLIESGQAMVSDVSADQLKSTASMTGCATSASNADVARFADVVVLAVKPYQVADVCGEISGVVRSGQLFVSICAGIPCAFIEACLGPGVRVARVMPNTPALIGCGAAAVAGGSTATEGDVSLVCRVFESVGVAVKVGEEKLDLVTGLTGSGPAYLFHFAEALIAAGVELGLSPEDAETLVKQTVLGAARMAVESGRSLEDLRKAVTTKGGTTAAGLDVLADGGFAELVKKCVDRATARSRELAAGN